LRSSTCDKQRSEAAEPLCLPGDTGG
jgi:hypothetical protein